MKGSQQSKCQYIFNIKNIHDQPNFALKTVLFVKKPPWSCLRLNYLENEGKLH